MNLHLTLTDPGMHDAQATCTHQELAELLASAGRHYTRVYIKDEQGKSYCIIKFLGEKEWLPSLVLESLCSGEKKPT